MGFWRTAEKDRPAQPQMSDEQEWREWRGFVGSKHICKHCGAVVGDPDLHDRWHLLNG